MQNYKSVDVFKFLAAILVMALHTQIFYGNETLCYYTRCFCRIAVPFFFCISSYLFWVKKTSLKKYAKRILTLYLVWFIIELPYVIQSHFINDRSISINLLLFVRDLLFHNTFHASWYLMSSVIGMTIIVLLSKHHSTRKISFISIMFFICSLLSTSYHGLIDNTYFGSLYKYIDFVFVPSNSFFVSLVYISIGKGIAEGTFKCSKQTAFVCLFISLLVWTIEVVFSRSITRLTDAFIMLPFVTFFLVKSLFYINIKISETISNYLRKSSILIYLLHYVLLDLNIQLLAFNLGTFLFVIVFIETISL